MKKRVAVIGATGKTGRRIVHKLIEQNIPVRVLSRNAAKAKKLFGDRVEIIEGDLVASKNIKALVDGVTHVFTAQGADDSPLENGYELIDFGGTKKMLASIPKGQHPHIIHMSSIYVERPNPPVDFPGDPIYWKRKAELALIKSGHPYTIVRPGWLNNLKGGQRRINAEQGDTGDGKITRDDVAEVLVQAMHVKSSEGKIFEIFNGAGAPVSDWKKFFSALHR